MQVLALAANYSNDIEIWVKFKQKSSKHEQKVPAPRSTSVHVFQSTMSTSPSSVPAMHSSGREAAIISPNRPSEKINLKQLNFENKLN